MKKLLFLILLIFFAQTAMATEVIESSFIERGYSNFTVSGTNIEKCTQIEFVKPKHLEGYYPIISLGLTYGPTQKSDLNITLFLNGNFFDKFKTNDFYCQKECWKRIFIDQNSLEEKNVIQVCLALGESTTKATLLGTSKIGTYKTPLFSKKFFKSGVLNNKPIVGQDINAFIQLTNIGSLPAQIKMRNVREIVEEKKTLIDIQLIGENVFEGMIKPKEMKTINYKLRIKKPLPVTLPPGALYYENIFGEPEELFSNWVDINAREPEKPLEPIVLLGDVKPDGEFDFKIIVKNNTKNTLYNAQMNLELDKSLEVFENNKTIKEIDSGEIIEYEFKGKTPVGEYYLGCEIKYLDYNLTDTECANVKVVLKNEPNYSLIVTIVFLIIAGLVYFYINYSSKEELNFEEEKPKERPWKF